MSGRLDALNLDGLKGVTAHHELPGPVILAGPNGVGKSAVLEGVRLCLAGPLAGATVEKLARRFPPRGGTVELRDASGDWVRRGVDVDGEGGAVREVLELPGETGGLKARSAAAAARWQADPVALDLGTLLARSPEERRAYLLGLAGASASIEREKLLGELAAELATELGGDGAGDDFWARLQAGEVELKERPKAAAEAWVAPGGPRERVAARLAPRPAWDPGEACAELLAELRDVKLAAARAAREAKAAAEELGAALGERQGAREALREAQGALRAGREAREAREARRSALEGLRGGLERAEERVRLLSSELEELEAGTPDLPAAPGKAPEAPAPIDRSRLETMQAKVREADEAYRQAAEDVAKAEAKLAKAGDPRKADAELRKLRAGVHAALDLAVRELPPSSRKAGKVLNLATAAEAVLQDWREKVDALQAEAEGLAELERVEVELRQARTFRTDCEAAKAARSGELEQARRETFEAEDRARSTYARELDRWRQASRIREDAERRLKGRGEALAQARAKLEEAERARDGTAARAALAAEEFEDLAPGPDLAELEACEARAREAVGALEALEAARRRSVEARGEEWAATAGEVAARRLRDRLLEGALAPLLGDVQDFLRAAGVPEAVGARLATPRGRPACDLGVLRGDGALVPLDALSGGEAVLLGAALAAALVRRLDGRKVLLLEADPCDDQNLGRLLRGLAATCGDLDACLVATSRAIADAPKAFTVREWTGGTWADRKGTS